MSLRTKNLWRDLKLFYCPAIPQLPTTSSTSYNFLQLPTDIPKNHIIVDYDHAKGVKTLITYQIPSSYIIKNYVILNWLQDKMFVFVFFVYVWFIILTKIEVLETEWKLKSTMVREFWVMIVNSFLLLILFLYHKMIAFGLFRESKDVAVEPRHIIQFVV